MDLVYQYFTYLGDKIPSLFVLWDNPPEGPTSFFTFFFSGAGLLLLGGPSIVKGLELLNSPKRRKRALGALMLLTAPLSWFIGPLITSFILLIPLLISLIFLFLIGYLIYFLYTELILYKDSLYIEKNKDKVSEV